MIGGLLTSLTFFQKQEKEEKMKTIVTRNDFDHLLQVNEICIICLDRSNEVVLTCGHKFCQICIDDWQEVNLNCPLCRITFVNDQDMAS